MMVIKQDNCFKKKITFLSIYFSLVGLQNYQNTFWYINSFDPPGKGGKVGSHRTDGNLRTEWILFTIVPAIPNRAPGM